MNADQIVADIIYSLIDHREANGVRFRKGVHEAMREVFRKYDKEQTIVSELASILRGYRVRQ